MSVVRNLGPIRIAAAKVRTRPFVHYCGHYLSIYCNRSMMLGCPWRVFQGCDYQRAVGFQNANYWADSPSICSRRYVFTVREHWKLFRQKYLHYGVCTAAPFSRNLGKYECGIKDKPH